MSSAASPQHPDHHHGHRSTSSRWMTNRLHTKSARKGPSFADDYYSLVDESPEFHDPYSDLNLYLSQKVRGEMRKEGILKKWSLKIQEALLEKIAPEFQKKFPHYRLGVTALRKTWEKVAYYTQQIETQKEATDEKGNLRLTFLIGENLRHYPQLGRISGVHPYHYAHQLGLKISECIAVVDGMKPSLDQLTRLIWAMQRHLLSWETLQDANSPYDEFDRLDKQIVKAILEIKTHEPHLTAVQLEAKVSETFTSLMEIPAFNSQETLLSSIAALIADKLYPTSRLHTSIPVQKKNVLLQFIARHIDISRAAAPKPLLSDLVRRILSLYLLATQIPKNLDEKTILEIFEATYNRTPMAKPIPNQALLAFISAEITMREDHRPIEEIALGVLAAYKEAVNLPVFSPDELEIVEISIWRRVSEKEQMLATLPYRIGQRIETEIALQLIDEPKRTFSSLVHHTYQSFHKMREALGSRKPAEMNRKIHLWSTQGDLLYRNIRFEREMPLLRLILRTAEQLAPVKRNFSHEDFVGKVCEGYLREHPSLSCYSSQLFSRIYILYKYVWFTLFSNRGETSLDRFISWHAAAFDFSQGTVPFIAFMQTAFAEQFPFLPFDPKQCEKIALSQEILSECRN